MPTPPRRCSTCRHFQPAPLWRRGWCRHPLLYAPHQNHLVDERELDCQRQFGDYWEPVEAETTTEPPATAPVVAAGTAAAASGAAPASNGGPAAVPAAADQSSAKSTAAALPPPAAAGKTSPPPRSDRLRLIVPAVIIGGLVIGYLLWSGVLMQTTGDVPTPTAIAVTATPASVSTPAAIATAAAATVAPTSPPTPRPTTPPTALATVATAATPATRVATPGIRAGAAALVDTGSNDGLRLRREPGSVGVVLRSIRNGERVAVLDGPRDADGITWWRVAYAGDEGWVAGQYLKPPPG